MEFPADLVLANPRRAPGSRGRCVRRSAIQVDPRSRPGRCCGGMEHQHRAAWHPAIISADRGFRRRRRARRCGNSDDVPLFSKAVRIHHIDLRDLDIGFDGRARFRRYRRSRRGSELSQARPDGGHARPGQKRIKLAISAFPGITISHVTQSAAAAGNATGWFGSARNGNQVEEIQIKGAETYGVSTIEAIVKFNNWCRDEKTRAYCQDAYVGSGSPLRSATGCSPPERRRGYRRHQRQQEGICRTPPAATGHAGLFDARDRATEYGSSRRRRRGSGFGRSFTGKTRSGRGKARRPERHHDRDDQPGLASSGAAGAKVVLSGRMVSAFLFRRHFSGRSPLGFGRSPFP